MTTTTTRTGIGAQAAPYAAVALLAVAAAATHAIAEVTDETGTVTMSVAGIAVVLAVAVATKQGRRIACRIARSRLYAFLTVAAGWLTTITAAGLSLDAVKLLGVMVGAISLHWWRTKRIPNPGPEIVLPDTYDRYIQQWADHVGCASGVLPGSRLQSPEKIDSGYRYVLRLVPGRQTYGAVLGMLEQLRGGLHLLTEHDLIVERHPVLSAANLLLTIVTRSPIKNSVTWPGPQAFNPTTGCVDLGPHTDGEGVAAWRVYTDNSLWGGYMTGSSGSGKSRMFESIAMSVAASQSHPTVVWFADGDEGASSPLLMKHADHTALDAELTQARMMLAGALLIMQLRRAENVAFGLDGFTPTAERPGLLIFIDECHVLFADKDIQQMAAEITRRGRKVGVNIIAASQVGTLDAFGGAGGAADVLRSSLRAGNAVILRSLTNNTKHVFGVDINPTQFPHLPGYAYYVAAKGSAARTAPFRGYYVDDTAKEHWAPRIHWRSLSEGEGNAYGTEYSRRRELAEQERQNALRWIADTKAGLSPTPAAKPITYTIPTPTTPAWDFDVAQFPTWDPACMRPTGPKLTDTHHRLIEAIHSGAALTDEGFSRPGLVAAHLGISDKWAGNLLADLVSAGVVRKGDIQGRYYPIGTGLTQQAA